MSTKKRRAKNAPSKPTNSPNSPNKADSARRQAATASPTDDPAEFLTNVVEDDATIEDKPKVTTELAETDRAAILGQDGRWAAGWASPVHHYGCRRLPGCGGASRLVWGRSATR